MLHQRARIRTMEAIFVPSMPVGLCSMKLNIHTLTAVLDICNRLNSRRNHLHHCILHISSISQSIPSVLPRSCCTLRFSGSLPIKDNWLARWPIISFTLIVASTRIQIRASHFHDFVAFRLSVAPFFINREHR